MLFPLMIAKATKGNWILVDYDPDTTTSQELAASLLREEKLRHFFRKYFEDNINGTIVSLVLAKEYFVEYCMKKFKQHFGEEVEESEESEEENEQKDGENVSPGEEMETFLDNLPDLRVRDFLVSCTSHSIGLY